MRNNKRILTMCMSIFFVLGSFIGCGAEEKNTAETENIAKGYQWEVTKDGKTLYLIGTMHPINRRYNYFSEKVENIISKTDVLAVEVNPSMDEQIEAASELLYLNDKTIENELTKDQIKKLKDLCEDADLKYDQIKMYKPLGINQLISEVVAKKAGLKMETFDDMLIKRYGKDGKKVEQVETIDFQMKLLNKIMGKEALINILNEYEKGKFEEYIEEDVTYSKNLMEAYKNGDEKVMNEAIEIQKKDKEVYKALVYDRNIDMVKKIEEYIKSDESYVVAVGALHFFGEDGIVKLLENKGYVVKKL